MDLPRTFVTEVRRSALLAAGSHVVVACSGGGDSSALAVLLAGARAELGIGDLTLAHLDHALRQGSADDAEQTRRLAGRLGVPIVVERRPVVRRSAESPEAAARRVRFGFLRETAAARGADVVATAHTADDQAETLLLRILRGTGLRGLRGIPARRRLASGIDVVRPLLPFRGAELRAFLVDRGVTWAEDPTNRSGNARARVRHVVLPLLSEISDRDAVPLLVRLARNASEQRDDVLGVARRFVALDDHAITLLPGHERLPRGALRRALADAAGELRRTPQGLSRTEGERLLAAMFGTTTDAVAGLQVVAGPGGARVVRAQASEHPPSPLNLDTDGAVAVPWAGVRIHLLPSPRLHLAPAAAEVVDAESLRGPLVVRPPLRGERFVPLGGGPLRRVRSLLGKRGVAATERMGFPVVADLDGVVVLPGVTLADRVKITPETTSRLAIGATPLEGSRL